MGCEVIDNQETSRPSRWADPAFVRRWDTQTLKSSVVRRQQVDIVVEIIASGYRNGRHLVDLGCGTGLVDARILGRRPRARITGVDSSPVMVDFAARRLSESPGFWAVQHDMRDIESLALPPRRCQSIFSVMTMHELSPADQHRVMAWAHERLEPGGMFIINDKLKPELDDFYAAYQAAWDWQESQKPAETRISFRQHMNTRFFKDGYPATLDENLDSLRKAGFKAECLHLHLNRAVIVARK